MSKKTLKTLKIISIVLTIIIILVMAVALENLNDSVLPFFGVVIILLIVVILFFSVAYKNKFPVATASAKVYNKSIKTLGGVSHIDENDFLHTVDEKNYYYISFEYSDRISKSVQVDFLLYDKLSEGDKGTLFYKDIDGKFIFVNFKGDI
ncbi:MAG: DUF2500 domain-containing protein [Oscillospiraceae bacterium]|nr:DUF2500 domain-containing protein [Oscillospiraceae bacterium]